jgi:hypothetical protein
VDNKLIMAGACVLDQCVTGGLIRVRITGLLPEPPAGVCVGQHDLGEGYVGLTLVGSERIFRSTERRVEVVGAYYLEARRNGNPDL